MLNIKALTVQVLFYLKWTPSDLNKLTFISVSSEKVEAWGERLVYDRPQMLLARFISGTLWLFGMHGKV